MIKTVAWNNGKLRLLDQLLLPHKTKVISCANVKATGEAIRIMQVRGAPAIGVTAGYGMAQAALASKAKTGQAFLSDLRRAGDFLKSTRPTAVNLAWAVDRVLDIAQAHRADTIADLKKRVVAEAKEIQREDIELCARIAKHGGPLVPRGARVLTHCNTGALATAGVGTALGVLTTAFAAGKKMTVWVDETRPYLQGARLTAFELKAAKIPHTLITDNSAASLMAMGKVDLVIVGADRITTNGDVANKIGTYGLAVLAKFHGVPFYVAAPSSTVDLKLKTGAAIPIEERSADEVLFIQGKGIAPKGTKALHLGFDVTPHGLISAIITEKGVARAPFNKSLKTHLKA